MPGVSALGLGEWRPDIRDSFSFLPFSRGSSLSCLQTLPLRRLWIVCAALGVSVTPRRENLGADRSLGFQLPCLQPPRSRKRDCAGLGYDVTGSFQPLLSSVSLFSHLSRAAQKGLGESVGGGRGMAGADPGNSPLGDVGSTDRFVALCSYQHRLSPYGSSLLFFWPL